MSDKDISKMDFKELRKEVQKLRDELARAKRYFGDSLEHLDYDNFSSRVVKDKKGMETSIKQTAEAITLQAKDIKELSTSMSELKITAGEISAKVSENYEDLDGKITSNTAKISVTADEILQTVSETYQTLDAAARSEWELQSQISQTSDSIKSVVRANYSGEATKVDSTDEMSDVKKLYYNTADDLYYHWNGEEWEPSQQANFGTVFEQTTTGFALKGNVTVDGSLVTNISTVNDILFLGNEIENFERDDEESTMIILNETVKLSSYQYPTSGFYGGLRISAAELLIPEGTRLNLSGCEIGWGNNAPVAVFG